MHHDHQVFLGALHDRQKILLAFYSKEDGAVLNRTCAPMDFGPSRRIKDKSDRYHLWDFDSDTGSHTLSLLPVQVVRFDTLPDQFDPAAFVTWDLVKSPWFVPRNWGRFS